MIAHVPSIALADVVLVVRPGGQERVLRTGVREVHAHARGTRIDLDGIPAGAVEIGYNPFEAPHFTVRPGFSKVLACRLIVFTHTGKAWALL